MLLDLLASCRTNNWKLPAFAMCASPDHIDIPVPDFTFDTYPEAGYSNSSWAAVGGLLGLKGRLVPWKVKSSHMFMRHHKGAGELYAVTWGWMCWNRL